MVGGRTSEQLLMNRRARQHFRGSRDAIGGATDDVDPFCDESEAKVEG
jgi:hypothetical protein